ncbi:hypothetical protein TYRP_019503 [Tyrophagus putrescentiae]|nr:hypothetical protein TYRP_019503 [Tyrophagus putrescentiae]
MPFEQNLEVTLRVVYCEMQSAVRVRDPVDTERNFVSGNVGSVVPRTEMVVFDLITGEPLPPGEKGEVCFRGGGVFAGYLDNPEATAKTIINGWLHSGDVGHYDHKGRLFICDRLKELIKYRQYSVVPAEVEDYLIQSHKGVAAVCVVGVPHQKNMGTQKRLRAGVRFIETMPVTLIGKVDRQYFKKLVAGEMITEVIE